MMKVALINTVANTGSTGRITQSLYKEILVNGDEAILVYGRGQCPEEIKSYKVGTGMDFLTHVFRHFFTGMGGFFSTRRTERLIRYLEEENPDLIHLHNIHGFYLNCEKLFEYIKRKKIPVIWTLHDCWSFTGHCAYFDFVECEKWKKECYNCPQFRKAYPYSLFRDNTRKAYARKKRAFQNVDSLVLVTPCKWLEEKVKASFLGQYETKVIYNGIDKDKFYKEPHIRKESKKVILGVANIWEKRKGLNYFLQALERLDEHYQGVLVGINPRQSRKIRKKFPESKLRLIHHTQDIKELRELYNEADVFVNPTLEDNFPTTNLEAMACGLPVVTFDTGGCAEAVLGTEGRVVPKKDVDALVTAIQFVCGKNAGEQNGQRCTKIFDNKKMLQEYMELYRGRISSK